VTRVLANALWKIEPAATPTMSQDAAILRVDPSTVTFIASRLEDKGLIAREPDPADRRNKVISLTQRGREVRDQLAAAMFIRSYLCKLSADELPQLKLVLAKAVPAKDTPT